MGPVNYKARLHAFSRVDDVNRTETAIERDALTSGTVKWSSGLNHVGSGIV